MADLRLVRDGGDSDLQLRLEGKSREDTGYLASLLAPYLKAPCSLGLSGQLGAGKTEFVRSLLTELGVSPSEITSPSFVLENVYDLTSGKGLESGIRSIYHWDLYRLRDKATPLDLLERLESEHALVLVEWPRMTDVINLLSMELMIAIPDSRRDIGLVVSVPTELAKLEAVPSNAVKTGCEPIDVMARDYIFRANPECVNRGFSAGLAGKDLISALRDKLALL